ncbi:MAG: transferase protein [Ignavibacteria bacterium]|nr:transferase protein [Ignavibacteria bacterium]
MEGQLFEKGKVAAVIMAGGSGARLWPRSTENNPKQFIHLTGEGTLIQNTYQRLAKIFPPEDIYIITLESMAEIIEYQLPQFPKENIFVEPFGKNTAPALALSALQLSEKYSDDAVLAAFPADHVIFNWQEFCESIETAYTAASEGDRIVILGVQASRPETNYGYVQYKKIKDGLGNLFDKGLRYSTTFAEKPDISTARRFIESGDFLWNSGIFIWRFDTFWTALEKYLLEDASLFRLQKHYINRTSFKKNIEHLYRQISSVSIDYAILEKADNVFVVESSFRWSDVGTWDELYRISMKDAKNNVIEGDVISINTTDCFINSNARIIGTAGIKDLIIVDSDYALLICRRGASDDVKELVDVMKRRNINKHI